MASGEFRFRTPVSTAQASFAIESTTPILSIGSCFANTIAHQLADNHCSIVHNPSGILFNPASIADLLDRLIARKEFVAQDIFLHNALYKSLAHHSFFNDTSIDACLKKMNTCLHEGMAQIQDHGMLIITVGTAYAYLHKKTKAIAANCHTLPSSDFERILLDDSMLIERWSALIDSLLQQHPHLSIIMTVSPVRHLRDTPFENSVSKGRCTNLIYQLMQQFPTIFYFPAYEILLDELRDYRFYDTDMVHPSVNAIEYIWDIFVASCISKKHQYFMLELAPIHASMQHTTNSLNVLKNNEMATKMLDRISRLEALSGITLESEKTYFQKLCAS